MPIPGSTHERRALFECLGVRYLAQGQCSEGILAPLVLPAHLTTFVCNQGLNQEPFAFQSSPLQTNHIRRDGEEIKELSATFHLTQTSFASEP